MGLDIRTPDRPDVRASSALLLAVYGLMTNGSAIYERSLGINVNLGWGVVMLVFGGIMLWLGWKGGKKA